MQISEIHVIRVERLYLLFLGDHLLVDPLQVLCQLVVLQIGLYFLLSGLNFRACCAFVGLLLLQ